MAPSSLRSLISSPVHANMLRFFPYSRRLCWRLPFCEALFLRRVTPTRSGFSHIAGGFVGASSLRSLISPPGHANILRFFPGGRRPCWRRPPCEALFLRRATPTCSGFSRAVAAHVGAVLPAKPYFSAGSRQHAPVFPGRSPPMLAPSSLRSLISSPGHTNTARAFPNSHFRILISAYSAST